MIEQALAGGCRKEGGDLSLPTLRKPGQLSSRGVIVHSSIPQPHQPHGQDLSVGCSAFSRLAIVARARLRQAGSLTTSERCVQSAAAL